MICCFRITGKNCHRLIRKANEKGGYSMIYISFDFLQDSETFAHRLSWHLRQAVIKYIVDSREDSEDKIFIMLQL